MPTIPIQLLSNSTIKSPSSSHECNQWEKLDIDLPQQEFLQ